MASKFLPYGKQDITDSDVNAVVEALRSDFLTTGPRVQEFEEAFSQYVGAPHCIAVSNGTAALHLACMALDISKNDCVLVPTMSFAASTNGAAYCGADIEFMDCDPDSGLVTPETFKAAHARAVERGKQPRLAVIVHLNGEHADMQSISKIAEAHKISIIEDACHALGTVFKDENDQDTMVGACRYSIMATYSTHPVKTITTGEGGVILTQDTQIAKRLRLLRNHGLERDPNSFEYDTLAFDSKGEPNLWYYELQELGYNYRLTDIASALGTSQMKRMPQIASRRRELKAIYDELLAKSNLPVRPIKTPEGVDPVRHLYPVLIDFDTIGIERNQFCKALRERGIGSQVHYIPTHIQPFYRKQFPVLSLPGSQEYYRRIISLPLFPLMKDDDPKRVIDAISAVLA
ncbi:MAG: UDP-4-amino-4,6-dideoxy-N-acetyl-beta-L-altrosamine transaminase [Pseudomonadota bacterium]